MKGGYGEIEDGVKVVHRSDYNYNEVAQTIADTIIAFACKTADEVKEIRQRAARPSDKALWSRFIQYYLNAYDIALKKVTE